LVTDERTNERLVLGAGIKITSKITSQNIQKHAITIKMQQFSGLGALGLVPFSKFWICHPILQVPDYLATSVITNNTLTKALSFKTTFFRVISPAKYENMITCMKLVINNSNFKDKLNYLFKSKSLQTYHSFYCCPI